MEKTKYFDLYFEKLEKSGVSKESCDLLKEKYGKLLNSASFATLSDAGMAFDGSLIEITLTKLAVYAIKVNNLFPEDLRIDPQTLVKIALLQHISKAIRTEKCTEGWRLNRGELYSYKNDQPSIGTGLHSIAMCTECGINLTPLEMEAMICIDRSADTDMQFKWHCNFLPRIIQVANDLVYAEYNKKSGISL